VLFVIVSDPGTFRFRRWLIIFSMHPGVVNSLDLTGELLITFKLFVTSRRIGPLFSVNFRW